MYTTSSVLLALLPIASAHFALNFPASRSTDDTNQNTFPCGGHDVVTERTRVSLEALALSMELGHSENYISVFLALGNEPGDAFNTALWPTVLEMGPGDFCWQSIPIPSNLSIEDGTNATIQVITNGHGGSGLYNCADITFTSGGDSPSSCSNGTGITAEFLSADEYVLANATGGDDGHGSGSDEEGADHSGHDEATSSTASSTAAEASATGSSSGAAGMVVGWTVLGAGVLGAAALL